MKLRSKMAIALTSSVILTLLLLWVLLYAFSALFIRGYSHDDLKRISHDLAQQFERARLHNDEEAAQAAKQFAERYKDIHMELFTSNGQLIFSSDKRSEPYEIREMMARFVDQPYSLFDGNAVTFIYKMNVNETQYFVIFALEGEALLNVKIYMYFHHFSSIPFLFTPLLLIITLPTIIAVVFILFLTRRIKKLNNAMQRADLHDKPIVLQDRSKDEIGQLTRLFNHMSENLHDQFLHIQQVEQARKELVSSLSHDLRTPLSVINGYAETLQRTSDFNKDTLNKHSTIILQKSAYMNQLLSQLFKLSELDHPSLEYGEKPTHVNRLIQVIVAEYVLLLEDLGIELDITIPDTSIWLHIHEQAIGQVIRNIIDNAIQYGQDGHYLGVTLSETADIVQVSITDRGRGISEEEQAHIFKRFYRIDKGRLGNGMGVGLSIASEIANKHGGYLTVQSHKSAWTTFTLTLPKHLALIDKQY